ncbi:MAG TPA: M48 family metallopeptidase [Candidatus Dormibacteraeota bacterium]|nr:M48 family metallopeptidase [Candidatus Dormibacteraeota bacterium]
MRWMHTLAGAGAVAALFSATAFAAPKKSTSQPSKEATSEEELIKDSGYTGWRLKWANINQIGDRNLCGGLNFFSLQKQIGMGKQIAQQVMQTSRLVTDPVITSYINKVGQNIVRNSDARIPYTFHVVDSDVVNAFSLPGGFVFVNSGLILRASDEAELAGVMAHETAHVAACHGAKQETKADITQLAMIPLSIMLPYGWAGYGIYEGVNAAIPLAFLKFSREDEAQADFLGTEYMYKAGYDPNAMISFFEKIEAEEKRRPGTIAPIFADHPPTPERMLWIQHEIATILPPRPEYLVDTSEFEAVRHRLALYEEGHKIQKKQGGPTLRQKTGQKNPKDKPPVLKRRDPNSPNNPNDP